MRKSIVTVLSIAAIIVPTTSAVAKQATPAPTGPSHCHIVTDMHRVVCDVLPPAKPAPVVKPGQLHLPGHLTPKPIHHPIPVPVIIRHHHR